MMARADDYRRCAVECWRSRNAPGRPKTVPRLLEMANDWNLLAGKAEAQPAAPSVRSVDRPPDDGGG
jgi:hypothetical protein